MHMAMVIMAAPCRHTQHAHRPLGPAWPLRAQHPQRRATLPVKAAAAAGALYGDGSGDAYGGSSSRPHPGMMEEAAE